MRLSILFCATLSIGLLVTEVAKADCGRASFSAGYSVQALNTGHCGGQAIILQQNSGYSYGGQAVILRQKQRQNFSGGYAYGGQSQNFSGQGRQNLGSGDPRLGNLIEFALPVAGAAVGAGVGGPFGAAVGAGAGQLIGGFIRGR